MLENEIDIVLPTFPENREEKRGIFATLMSGFIGLAYEDISSFLHNRRHKAVKVMNRQTIPQCNKLIHLENSMAMYGICNRNIGESYKYHTKHA